MEDQTLKILHISNGFCTSKVHSNLCRYLDSKVLRQAIYTYIDSDAKIGKNKFNGLNTVFYYDKILNFFVRKIYPLRVWWTFIHLKRKLNPKDYNCVFATTLFSDGGVANILFKRYKIPYIVAVRATDLTDYLRVRFFWKYGRENLLNAKRIVVINKSNVDRLRTYDFSMPIWDIIKDKIIVRPNGIDSFWLDNVKTEVPVNNHSILYVGSFISRKKVPQLIRAVESLLPDYPDLSLNLVGSGGDAEKEVLELAKDRAFVHLCGQVIEKKDLLEIYRSNGIFAMPSLYETFGLVYIEALSQNLRLLFTKGTGIDGILSDVGVAVNNPTEESIADGLRQLLENYFDIKGNGGIDMSYFNWDIISDEYVKLFNEIKCC